MRVLVTGSDGFLGCLVTPQLMAEGHEVVGLDTLLQGGLVVPWAGIGMVIDVDVLLAERARRSNPIRLAAKA